MNTLQLFGLNNIGLGSEAATVDYKVIVVHLEWNLVFLVGEVRTPMTYDISCRKVHVLPTQVIRCPRPTWSLCINGPHYLPYVPLLMESLAEQ